MSKTRKLDSKGFTLIELLIVIIIIGILAAIAFEAYGSATSKAHKSDAQATLASVKEKLASFQADAGGYPTDQTALDTWLASSAGGNNKDLSTKFTSANGYTYTAVPTVATNTTCGYTVATDGTTTINTTNTDQCKGFTLKADGATIGFSGTIEQTN